MYQDHIVTYDPSKPEEVSFPAVDMGGKLRVVKWDEDFDVAFDAARKARIKKRCCLGCDKIFTSYNGDRICGRCHRKNRSSIDRGFKTFPSLGRRMKDSQAYDTDDPGWHDVIRALDKVYD